MSKLQAAIDAILEEALEGTSKTAELETEQPVFEKSPMGRKMSKLASAMRDISVEPTYADLNRFLGSL